MDTLLNVILILLAITFMFLSYFLYLRYKKEANKKEETKSENAQAHLWQSNGRIARAIAGKEYIQAIAYFFLDFIWILFIRVKCSNPVGKLDTLFVTSASGILIAYFAAPTWVEQIVEIISCFFTNCVTKTSSEAP